MAEKDVKKTRDYKKVKSNSILALAFVGVILLLSGLIGTVVGITIFLYSFFPWLAFLFLGVVICIAAYLLSLILESEEES